MGSKNLSRRFSDPRSSGDGATVKNFSKQAILPISAGLVPSLVTLLGRNFAWE